MKNIIYLFLLTFICIHSDKSYAQRMGGYAELEVYIPNIRFNYTVSIDGQTISNNTGVYKFQNITPGINEIIISSHRGVLYNGNIEITRSRNTIAEYSKTRGLEIIEVQFIQMQDDVVRFQSQQPIERPMRDRRIYEHYEHRQPHVEMIREVNVMDNRTFEEFRMTIRNQGFSSTKLDIIRNTAINTLFTTNQVASILDELSFESDK